MKTLQTQKRLAAQILKVGKNRIWFDPDRLEEIKEAITKADIKSLIRTLAIQKKQKIGTSSYRTKKRKLQKRKGRKKGPGSRKGKRTARLPSKLEWMLKIRAQRNFLKLIKDKKIITPKIYNMLYKKAKGGFFRSIRHIKLYLKEHSLVKEKK